MITVSAYERVTARLSAVTGFNPGEHGDWRCPAHEDRTASLSVNRGEKGVVLCCHANCSVNSIVAALDLTLADLFDERPRPTERRIVAEYDYLDVNGARVFQTIRYDPKDFRQRRPDGMGGWVWKLDGVSRVLYRLPELVAGVAAGRVVYVVEGEKDVEALVRAGQVATCCPMGAGKWRPEYNQHLTGARVVIVADRDVPGWRHALDVAEQVAAVAEETTVVEARKGKDAADHLAAGLSPDDFVPVTLDELRRRIEPVDQPAEPVEEVAERPATLNVRWVAEAVDQPPAEHPVFVEGMLRAGELCVIGAPRAIGKSWFGMNLACLLDRGSGHLGGNLAVRRSARTLYCQGEIDEWESARRWKMLTGDELPPLSVAETFDRWRVRTVKRRSMTSSNDPAARTSDSQEWIDAQLDTRLEATIAEHGIEVVIIDPWAVYFAGNENSNDETEAALDKLRDLTLRHGVAIVILHHIGKATDSREPEDLWRGASRLADWASTRITVLPHWTDKQAGDQGMTRQQARRYVDVRFLRRSTPTDDFSMHLDPETGWWQPWTAPDVAGPAAQRIHLEFADLVDACRKAGGSWPSTKQAAEALDLSEATARRILQQAATKGHLQPFEGARGARGWRLPEPQLQHLGNDDDERF